MIASRIPYNPAQRTRNPRSAIARPRSNICLFIRAVLFRMFTEVTGMR